MAKPTIRAVQDYVRVVPANSTITIKAPGEFIYCKFADRPVRLTISGSTVEMESGDNHRAESVFDEVEVTNRTSAPLAVTFVIGFGEFTRQIVQGEVAVVPGIRDEAGRFQTDTRQVRKLFVRPDYEASQLTSQGEHEELLELGDVAPFDYSGFSEADWTGTHLLIYASAGSQNQHLLVLDGNLNFAKSIPLSIDPRSVAVHNGYVYAAMSYAGAGSLENGRILKSPLPLDAMPDGEEQNLGAWGTWFDPEDWPDGHRYAHAITFDPDGGRWYAWLSDSQGGDDRLYEFGTATQSTTGRSFDPGEVKRGMQAIGGGSLAFNRYDNYAVYNIDGTKELEFSMPGYGSAYGNFSVLWVNGVGYIVADGSSSSEPDIIARVRTAPSDGQDVITGTSLEGAGEACLCVGALLKRTIRHVIGSNAAIAVDRGAGEWTVSGEIIKLALQLTGEAVPDDYLDHVYGIEAAGVSLYAGPQSFAAAGIDDNFTTTLPGVVTLTVDRTLANG